MNVFYLILIIVGALLGIASFFAFFAKLAVWRTYVKGNSTRLDSGLTGEQAANMLLEKLNLSEVEVKQLNWFTASIYGNHYNARKKVIYLRKNIFSKSTVTAVSLATQKVALAIQHKNKDKSFIVKSKLQPVIILAPVLFIPLALVGIIFELIILHSNIGTLSIVFIIIGLLFYLLAFIFTLVNLPVEKKANTMAMKIIAETNIIEEDKQNLVRKIYKAYIISYVADFIMALLYLIQFILKLLFKFVENK